MSSPFGATRTSLRYASFIVALLIAAGLAAWSSSSSRASVTRSTHVAKASAHAAKAKAPIVIGDTCDCSGVQAASEGEWYPAIKVWQDWINSYGGIDGHKVVIDEMDNKTEPTAALTNTKALLANPKVIALIPGSGQGVVVSKVIAAAKAPVVGGLGDDATWGSNKYVFPVATTAAQLAGVLAAIGVKHSSNKNAADLYCAEVATCAQSLPLFAAGVKAAGGRMVYSTAISSSAPNYTAPCLEAQARHAGFMWIAEGPPQIINVVNSCHAQGYHPLIVIPNYTAEFATTPAMQGSQYAFGDATYNGSNPAAKQFEAAVSKFAPGIRKQAGYGQYSFQAWLSGQAIARAIYLADPKGTGTFTRATVLKGLYMFKKQTLYGGAPDLTFTKGHIPTVPCGFSSVLKGGALHSEGAICSG